MAKHLGLPAVVFLALCCHLCRCQVNIDPNLEVELQFSVVLERNSSTTTATTTPTQESTAISTGIISSDGTASPMAPETTSSTVKESAAASSTEPETTTSTVMESTAASSTEPETTTSTVMESTVTITVSAMETSENTATSEQYETVSTEDPDTNASDTSNETFSDQLLADDWASESFLQEQLANEEAQDIEEIREELEDYLKKIYRTTIGYRNLTIPTPLDDTTVKYLVVYNVKELSENGSLASGGDLDKELKELASTFEGDFGGYYINTDATETSMTAEISTVFEETLGRVNLCGLIGACACNDTSTLCNIDGGKVECQPKCNRYLKQHKKCDTSSLAVVFVEGKCKLDDDNNPFCNCGKSPGDVLSNFFDGEQCVSAAFIVGFSATAGGVILVVLLAAVIALAVSNSNKSKQLKKNSLPVWTGPNDANPSGNRVLNEYDNAGFQGNGHGPSYHEEASHDNHSYKPDVDDPEAMSHHSDGPKITSTADNLPDADDTNQQIIELMETDTVKNFQPHVSHIDSTVDYSIKRPTISIKSPSSNASDRV